MGFLLHFYGICRRQSGGISTMRGGIFAPEWVFCCIFTVFAVHRAEEFLQCAEEFSHQNEFSAAFLQHLSKTERRNFYNARRNFNTRLSFLMQFYSICGRQPRETGSTHTPDRITPDISLSVETPSCMQTGLQSSNLHTVDELPHWNERAGHL